MAQIYIDHRSLVSPQVRPAIDISQYLQVRHNLGKSLIICDNPIALLSATRKQWVKICRQLQRSRASTLNAEEILRHTRKIIQMQQLQFSVKPPQEDPEADIYFMHPESYETLPSQIATIFITTPVTMNSSQLASKLPIIMIIDYDDALTVPAKLPSKNILEEAVREKWLELTQYLKKYDINAERLSLSGFPQSRLMDSALDTLVNSSDSFIHHVYEFQQLLDAAQPLQTFDQPTQDAINATVRLAYRVHTLTPAYTLKYTNLTDNNFFLRDSSSKKHDTIGEMTCTLPHIYQRASAIIHT